MLIDKLTRDADYEANPHVSEINNPENAIFQKQIQNYMLQLLVYQKKMI